MRAFVESRLFLGISLRLGRRETQIAQRRSLRIRGGLRLLWGRTLRLIRRRLAIGIDSEVEGGKHIGYRTRDGALHRECCWVAGRGH